MFRLCYLRVVQNLKPILQVQFVISGLYKVKFNLLSKASKIELDSYLSKN